MAPLPFAASGRVLANTVAVRPVGTMGPTSSLPTIPQPPGQSRGWRCSGLNHPRRGWKGPLQGGQSRLSSEPPCWGRKRCPVPRGERPGTLAPVPASPYPVPSTWQQLVQGPVRRDRAGHLGKGRSWAEAIPQRLEPPDAATSVWLRTRVFLKHHLRAWARELVSRWRSLKQRVHGTGPERRRFAHGGGAPEPPGAWAVTRRQQHSSGCDLRV